MRQKTTPTISGRGSFFMVNCHKNTHALTFTCRNFKTLPESIDAIARQETTATQP
jgi:hypothetical protein